MPVKVDIIGYREIEKKLEDLPEEVVDICIGDVQEYLFNVLRSDQPPKNYITRKAAYGQSFFTKKQRNWFFWALSAGNINVPYKRTQEISKGWKLERKGLFGYITNDAPGVQYVIGDNTQSRHERMVGWKTVKMQLLERKEKIEKIIDSAAKKAIRKLGL